MSEYEYRVVGTYVVFYAVMALIMGLIGQASLTEAAAAGSAVTTEDAGINWWSGFKESLTNPYRQEPVVGILYTLFVLSPIALLAVLMGANYVRGR